MGLFSGIMNKFRPQSRPGSVTLSSPISLSEGIGNGGSVSNPTPPTLTSQLPSLGLKGAQRFGTKTDEFMNNPFNKQIGIREGEPQIGKPPGENKGGFMEGLSGALGSLGGGGGGDEGPKGSFEPVNLQNPGVKIAQEQFKLPETAKMPVGQMAPPPTMAPKNIDPLTQLQRLIEKQKAGY